jgi:hypothetical protein
LLAEGYLRIRGFSTATCSFHGQWIWTDFAAIFLGIFSKSTNVIYYPAQRSIANIPLHPTPLQLTPWMLITQIKNYLFLRSACNAARKFVL